MRADSEQRLDREIALLRQRLEVAEEMRRAIVDEQVDAFVVRSNSAEPRLVLLETARPGHHTLLERVQEGALTVSEGGALAYANRRFATMAGRSLSQLFGLPLRDLVSRLDRGRFDAFLGERVADSSLDVSLDAAERPLAVRFTLVSVGSGHASLLVQDLSGADPLIDAENALRAIRNGEIDGVVAGDQVLLLGDAHRPYRALTDRMEQGAVTVSAHGDVLYANDRFASMAGVSRQRLLGKPLSPLLDGDAALVRALLDGSIAGAALHELAIVRADGSRLPVGVSAQRVEGVDAVTLIMTDLTEHKRHEAIEKDARRKDRFLAVLGHELRNPLASIRNAAEVLQQRAPQLGDDERLSVDVIGRQTATLVRLVDDLLDVHRLNEGKLVLRRQPVALATVIDNAIEATQPYLNGKHQSLDVSLPDEPVFVDGDPVRLVQVLLNLLSNAAKFTPDGGRIAVTLEHDRGAGGVAVARIRIADNGVGVAPDMLDRIFEAYMQVGEPSSVAAAGLGLGLSVARRLIELHGGSIQARSDGKGLGTTFTIELAACSPPPQHAAVPASAQPGAFRALRILVADDSEDNAQSLAMVLRLIGHETRIAKDGYEALAIADDFRPDVAVLDIDMPSLDGYETARALRERPWARAMLLCALTGWGQSDDRKRAADAGFDAHFVKPVGPDVLASAIEVHMRAARPDRG